MARTYLFYDTETSGLNVAFDQVLRFAAIRTDEELRELERHELSVRLRPDVVPAPEALLTTGLSIADLHKGVCEFEAMSDIHALFNTPETVSVGYNNLGFDDELLRFSFYRNLLPPYSHQHANGCGRMDLLPMTVMVRLFRRHWLTWPEIDGRVTLKLEHLNRENNLSKGRAHDAMVDVEATLELARRYARESREWRWLCNLFDKQEDKKRRDDFPTLCAGEAGMHRLALLAHTRVGAEDGYIAPVVSLGESIPYRNQTIWLRLDRDDLRVTTPDNVADTTWAYRKRDGDDLLLMNLRPKYVARLTAERQARMKANYRLLETRPELLAAIVDYHRNFRYPAVPEVDEDASLYLSLPSRTEEQAGLRFHSVPIPQRPALVDRMPTARFRTLAVRALGRNYPDSLCPHTTTAFMDYVRSVQPVEPALAPVDYKGRPRYTPVDALRRISELTADSQLSPLEREILAGLRKYLGEQFGVAVVGIRDNSEGRA